MKIRKARKEDLEDIRKLNQKLFVLENEDFDKTISVKSSLNEDHKKRFMENIKKDFTLVAVEGETIVGYLVGKIGEAEDYRNVGRIIELDSMFVDESHRSKGVGHMLVEEFKKWALGQGVKRLRVNASFGNSKAVSFYKREGFREYDLALEQDI